MNLIRNLDSTQSEINEAAIKIFSENSNIVLAYIMMPDAYSEAYQRSRSVLRK